MANLVVDMGNSRIKAALFEQDQLVRQVTVADPQELQALAEHASAVMACSVRADGLESLKPYIRSHLKEFSAKLRMPIRITYQTPETLGADRLAAVLGAYTLSPQTNVLVIDAGTCITYDLLQADETYPGGIIAPGLRMRARAMAEFTGKLPLVEPAEQAELVGGSTTGALASGVVNGAVSEMSGLIGRFVDSAGITKVMLTGGDAVFFEAHLKNSIFARMIHRQDHLVLIGLNKALADNNDH